MERSTQITLVGVVVLIVALFVGFVVIVSSVRRARDDRTGGSMCAANLKAIGSGISLYMAESDDVFPLLHQSGDVMEALDATTDQDDVEDLNHNAMQNVWLMMAQAVIHEQHFKCPSDRLWQAREHVEGPTGLRKYGWNSARNFSYGIHKPYGKHHQSPLTAPRQGSFPIFADKNWQADGKPGSVYYQGKSRFTRPGNHPRDGVNYLTYGSAVMKRPYNHGTVGRYSACGINGDDIYVARDNGGTAPGTADPAADPNLDTDCFILPWR